MDNEVRKLLQQLSTDWISDRCPFILVRFKSIIVLCNSTCGISFHRLSCRFLSVIIRLDLPSAFMRSGKMLTLLKRSKLDRYIPYVDMFGREHENEW